MSPSLVLPGDAVPVPAVQGKPLKLGPGLLHTSNDTVIATKYTPAVNESIIGVIAARSGEGYRVDIAGPHFAYLDGLAFEGASKRNRPNLKVGSIVYARVSVAHKDMEPELECVDANTRKSEGFGELKDGFLLQASLALCRSYVQAKRIPVSPCNLTPDPLPRLFDPSFFLLPVLGAKFPLEVVLGLNGRIWIRSSEEETTIAAARCIEAVDQLGYDENQVKQFLKQLDLG
ncbi:exosome non-catalytic core subunit rrp40 [Tulasnella sp. 403]|nr:exosome non-catalytic core subunit rrp40 [Tulasnella sp. 403]